MLDSGLLQNDGCKYYYETVNNTDKVDQLLKLVGESARSTEASVKRFIEPAAGTLQAATSRRHHIIFGRRGSGKT